jgi:fatty acid desaturase
MTSGPATTGTTKGSDFAALSREMKQAGLLQRTPGRYALRIALTLTLFACGWVAFALLGASWWQLGVAAFLAVMFTQVGFLGHDAGHRQIFRTGSANDAIGILLANLVIGLSFGWWKNKHNRHHAHPNYVGKDPDISSRAVLFSAEFAPTRRTTFTRLLGAYQAFLFLPALLLEGLHLHLASIRTLWTRPPGTRGWEAGLMATHIAVYLTALFTVLTPVQALAFIAVHQGLFGLYMGLAFAPNHKGMPQFGPNDDVDFLRRQVLTSRNVRGGLLVDNAMGGLNYQIEHHLFPSMPRANLRFAQPIVADFCARHGVSYLETSLFDSYRQALGHLHEVGESLRG